MINFFHIESMFSSQAVKDEENELIRPAVEGKFIIKINCEKLKNNLLKIILKGTINVLKAEFLVNISGVVLTSSTAVVI